jgi:Leucine-rich repeat (LRR) protein
MRFLFTFLFCLGLIGIVQAQNNPSPNELALQRIRASQSSGRGSLSLAGLGITELPPEIGNLTNLQTLWLNHNDLTSLPPEIGNLTNLQSLVLNHNQLSSLPAEIGNLSSLKELDLAYNELRGLPSTIGNLSSLNQLYLSNNQLRSLPPEMGKLASLTWLDLSQNQLGRLPEELAEVRLEYIDITGNSGPLAQVANKDTQSILAYVKNPLMAQFLPHFILSGIVVVLLVPIFIYYKKQPKKRRRIRNRA